VVAAARIREMASATNDAAPRPELALPPHSRACTSSPVSAGAAISG
jgi:hypothetical protein